MSPTLDGTVHHPCPEHKTTKIDEIEIVIYNRYWGLVASSSRRRSHYPRLLCHPRWLLSVRLFTAVAIKSRFTVKWILYSVLWNGHIRSVCSSVGTVAFRAPLPTELGKEIAAFVKREVGFWSLLLSGSMELGYEIPSFPLRPVALINVLWASEWVTDCHPHAVRIVIVKCHPEKRPLFRKTSK